MTETKREFKWFWAWNDEREEAWLREMAQQGWHLTKAGAFGTYTFEKEAPKDVVYRLDFRLRDVDKAEYLQLFADAGWEHVGEMNGWQYFRTDVAGGETPEIYTDDASKIKKYQRLLLFLTIVLSILSTSLFNLNEDLSPLMRVVNLISAGLMLLHIYAMIRLFLRIQELKKTL
jgi:hypothetical protein